ncbi:MAG: chemotaxis response regulator protein-glutamate methylesterase [Candidatus Aenigmarchaeota archaeon]|nr:chemotaxis response regulator protein-glutamate methylesterase [Candidatus Aenigmarchaeota archaeon]
MKNKINVLVVDDSLFIRNLISRTILSFDNVCVDRAVNGLEALEKLKLKKYDVVTLDVEMPKLDGLSTLEQIMNTTKTPVVMISSYTRKDGDITIKALELGAVDFIEKPQRLIIPENKIAFEKEIREKVLAAAGSNLNQFTKRIIVPKIHSQETQKILLIGASTGGPPCVERILITLPEDYYLPVVLVQHMPGNFMIHFINRLKSICQVNVKEARHGEALKKGTVYVCPGDHHIEIKKGIDLYISLNQKPKEEYVRPCVNMMFRSAAAAAGKNVIGVVLTGMGKDGTDGARAIKKNNGVVIAQDKATSMIYGMPKSIVDNNLADYVEPLGNIIKRVDLICRRKR